LTENTQEGPFKERSLPNREPPKLDKLASGNPGNPPPNLFVKDPLSAPIFVGLIGDFLRKGFERGQGENFSSKSFPLYTLY